MRPAAFVTTIAVALLSSAVGPITASTRSDDRIVHVEMAYRAPGSGPQPNFSPKGTQVPLTDIAPNVGLPEGAVRPARTGVMNIGPSNRSWIGVLATADAQHPADLCRLYIDRNRNGRFDDDGPAVVATPAQNEKTKAWWSSFNKVELSVPYGASAQPYLVNFWAVREGDAAPAVIRFSVGSWRFGTVTVDGVSALVAAMDSDNNAIFDAEDYWCALAADVPDAAKAVLSINEARPTTRLMFLQDGGREIILQFKHMSPDGSSMDFAVVDKPVTKAEDRRPDDTLAVERVRPRAKVPFAWGHDLGTALKQAASSHKLVFIDFETTWCGPCKSMDEWIFTDAEVADRLNAGYVGLKLDGDVEKALVKQYDVRGYPTMVIADPSGKVVVKLEGYRSSKEMLAALVAK